MIYKVIYNVHVFRIAIKVLNVCSNLVRQLETLLNYSFSLYFRGRRGRDRMVVGFTTTYATSAYHH